MSESIESTKVVEAVLERIRNSIESERFTEESPDEPESKHGSYRLYRLVPSNPDASEITFIASVGDTNIDIAVGKSGKFSTYAKRRESFDDYVEHLFELALAVTRGDWSESIVQVGDKVVSSAIKIRWGRKTFRSTSRFGSPLRSGKRTTIRIAYEAW